MSKNKPSSMATMWGSFKAKLGLGKKKRTVEWVNRGDIVGLASNIEILKSSIPSVEPVSTACLKELGLLANASNFNEVVQALIDLRDSLIKPIEINISPENKITNKIMKSALLVANDKVKEYAKNNEVIRSQDIAHLAKLRVDPRFKLPENQAQLNTVVNNRRNNTGNNNRIPRVEEIENNNPFLIENKNANNNNNNFGNLTMVRYDGPTQVKPNNDNTNYSGLGGGAKVRRKKATTGMKKKKVTTTAMKKKKATTTAMKKKKATATKKKATKKKATKK